MLTYSNPPTDATNLITLQSILNVLPDNTSKSINPKDIRDSVFTLWENISFKKTNSGTSDYIGIDSDEIYKIFLGKKKLNNQFILNNNLLQTDTDLFIYNNKTQSNHDTKIAILAGTGSNYKNGDLYSPYFKATDVSNPGYENTIDFEINNPTFFTDNTGTESGGNINIISEKGFVTINNLRLPTAEQNNIGLGNDGYILKYRWNNNIPFAQWEPSQTFSTADTLFSNNQVTITGNPVIVNGFPLEFTDSLPTPVDIGGVPAGTTFSNMPIVELLRMILYPYIRPVLSINYTYNLIEFGDNTTFGLQSVNWTITKNSTYSITSFVINTGYSGNLPSPGSIGNGTLTGSVTPTFTLSQFFATSSQWFTFSVTSNIGDSYPSSITSSANFLGVLPWYYGTSTFSATSSSGLVNINNILGTLSTPVSGFLTKLIDQPAISTSSQYNKTLNLSTFGFPNNQGYLYFGYPSFYPDLSQILDPNGYDVTSSWTKYTITGVQRTLWWTNRTYKFYIFTGVSASPILTTIGSAPNYFGNFQFKFS